MTNSREFSLLERLHGLSGFLIEFERSDFVFCHQEEMTKTESGVFTLPEYAFSPTADAFCRRAYKFGWVVPGFNWGDWMTTPEAAGLFNDLGALAKANPEQLAQLLTVLIRQERFCDGVLAEAFDSGLITGIIRRVAQIESDILADRPAD